MSKILIGDVMEVLPTLDAGSVHCVVTSPPYWGLRDYGTDGQLGLEATPEEHVERMVEVFREVRRVLRDDGTAWVNYGDSYAGGGGGNYGNGFSVSAHKTHPESGVNKPGTPTGLKPKDLVGMPWRVAFALQADGWYLRSDIIWAKPNPMPESCTDRPTKSHEHIFLLSKAPRYFYDADAVREEADTADHHARYADAALAYQKKQPGQRDSGMMGCHPAGRNLRDVWTVATHPYPGAHFATFPPNLIRPCIRAGTSEHGCCPECGGPWERVVESLGPDKPNAHKRTLQKGDQPREGGQSGLAQAQVGSRWIRNTTGWRPTCDHGHEGRKPAVVLDPFFGSGTTGLVCDQEGRDWIGIELSETYAEIARKRLAEKQELLF